jgi:hypothetical protein
MFENCKNCNEIITGNYCNHCGQKKYKRIDKKYVIDEVQYALLHANKGLLYSVKMILRNPGKTAKEFIEGNRVNHYKPLLLSFLLSGVATFISFKILDLMKIMKAYNTQNGVNAKYMGDLMTTISSYNSIIMVLMIPLFALTTKVAFKKWGHNYYEHVIINAYIFSYYTLISILFIYPVLYFLRDISPDIFMGITQFSLLLLPLIFIFFFRGFYTDKPIKSIILKTFATIGLLLLGYILIVILFSIGLISYITLTGAKI